MSHFRFTFSCRVTLDTVHAIQPKKCRLFPCSAIQSYPVHHHHHHHRSLIKTLQREQNTGEDVEYLLHCYIVAYHFGPYIMVDFFEELFIVNSVNRFIKITRFSARTMLEFTNHTIIFSNCYIFYLDGSIYAT